MRRGSSRQGDCVAALSIVIPDASRSDAIRDPCIQVLPNRPCRETWVPALAPVALGRDDSRKAGERLHAIGKKVAQLAISFLRRLVREIMAGGQRLGAADVGRVAWPDRGRVVVAADAA